MGTTDVSLGLSLLDCLDRLGVNYAVIHNASALTPGGETSDLDLALTGDVWEVTARLLEEQGSHGLHLAMLSEYDFGSLSSFWLSESGEDGVQLDLLADPCGRGRIGLLTEAALEDKVEDPDAGPPRLSAGAEAVYTLSKRILKRDGRRALAAIEALEAAEGVHAEAQLRRLLSPRMRRRAVRAFRIRNTEVQNVRGTGMHRLGWDLWRERLSSRGLARLAMAKGAVVFVPADREKVQPIADRLSLVFPLVEVRTTAPSRIRAWWLTRAPRLVLVTNREGRPTVTSVDIGRSITEELSGRTRLRIANRVRVHAGGTE